jgi:hypothetical protein
MGMVGKKRPRIAGRLGVGKDVPETEEKVLMVLTVFKDGVLFDAPDDNMVQSAGDIYAGFTGHGGIIS